MGTKKFSQACNALGPAKISEAINAMGPDNIRKAYNALGTRKKYMRILMLWAQMIFVKLFMLTN